MKLIFLDIDGVLNSKGYFKSTKYCNETSNIPFEDLIFDYPELNIDPSKIKLINDLVNLTGAKIVLSSSWRLFYDISRVQEILNNRGANFNIFGKTERIFADYAERGLEIKAFLNSLNEECRFVIFDDVEEMGSLEPFLVKTNSDIGLTEVDISIAIKILNGEK